MKIMLNRLKQPKNIAVVSITAALYVALTYMLAPVGYGMIQFRLSEVLCLLAFIDPVYGIGITIGCFFANLSSPFGLLDVLVGTFATLASVICISKSKNLFLASLYPTVFSLLTAAMIAYMSGVSFVITAAWLCLSEFIVVTLIGYPVFTAVLKNPQIYMLLKYKGDKATLQ